MTRLDDEQRDRGYAPLIEWDEVKNRLNIRKHGLSFDLAREVFADPNLLVEQDRFVDGEARWQAVGFVRGVLLLLVAHTVRDDEDEGEVIRIISARRVNSDERRKYERANR